MSEFRTRIDIVGRRFGRLVVLALARVGREAVWRCRCDCGAVVESAGSPLRRGRTTSCGCGRRQARSPEVAAARAYDAAAREAFGEFARVNFAEAS